MGILTDKGEDISNDGYKIYKAAFIDMRKRRKDYIKQHDKEPLIIYLPSPNNKGYVSVARMEEMEKRYNKYTREHNNTPPNYITVKPTAKIEDVTKGWIQKAVETKLGAFNIITGFCDKMRGRGYEYYYNDRKTLLEEINQLANLNCSDSTQLLVNLAREMGYTARYCRVRCKSGGHVYAELKGKELGNSWVKIDMAAILSKSSMYPIGRVWCSYAKVDSYDDPWLVYDDAKT